MFADAVQGMTRTEVVREWCRHNGLSISASFPFAFYGVDGASVIARAWVGRMQLLYNLGTTTGRDRSQFLAAELSHWTEPSEFTLLAVAYTARGNANRQLARLDQIRRL